MCNLLVTFHCIIRYFCIFFNFSIIWAHVGLPPKYAAAVLLCIYVANCCGTELKYNLKLDLFSHFSDVICKMLI